MRPAERVPGLRISYGCATPDAGRRCRDHVPRFGALGVLGVAGDRGWAASTSRTVLSADARCRSAGGAGVGARIRDSDRNCVRGRTGLSDVDDHTFGARTRTMIIATLHSLAVSRRFSPGQSLGALVPRSQGPRFSWLVKPR